MYYTLREFADEQLKFFKIKRAVGGDIDNPEPKTILFELELLIYKGKIKSYNPGSPDGGRNIGKLLGKSFEDADLMIDDVIIFENVDYRVVAIQHHPFSDFNEFELEMIGNEK